MEFLHIFWATSGNAVKFSGKMCLKIISKVTKNQSFTPSLEDTFFEPLPTTPAVLGLEYSIKNHFFIGKSLTTKSKILLKNITWNYCKKTFTAKKLSSDIRKMISLKEKLSLEIFTAKQTPNNERKVLTMKENFSWQINILAVK